MIINDAGASEMKAMNGYATQASADMAAGQIYGRNSVQFDPRLNGPA
jgi:hypothetical protein